MKVKLIANEGHSLIANEGLSVIVDLPVPLPEVVISEQRAFMLVGEGGLYAEATVYYQPPLLRHKSGARMETFLESVAEAVVK